VWRLVGSSKWQVSCAKEPYKRDDILPKRPLIWRSLLIRYMNKFMAYDLHTAQLHYHQARWLLWYTRRSEHLFMYVYMRNYTPWICTHTRIYGINMQICVYVCKKWVHVGVHMRMCIYAIGQMRIEIYVHNIRSAYNAERDRARVCAERDRARVCDVYTYMHIHIHKGI